MIELIFWHKDKGSFRQNLTTSAESGSWVLYWLSLISGHSLGLFIFTKQIFAVYNFSIPEIFIEIYLIVAGLYAGLNQLDVWAGAENRKFKKGEYIFLFWMFITLLCVLLHFFSEGLYPFPLELKQIWVWIGGFFATSKISAYIKLRQCVQKRSREDKRRNPDDYEIY